MLFSYRHATGVIITPMTGVANDVHSDAVDGHDN